MTGIDEIVSEPPALIELWDGERIRAWQGYHLSGASEIISASNLCHALLALATSGLLERLRGGRPQTRTELLTGMNHEIGSGFLRYLTVCGVLEEHDDTYRLSRRGEMLTSDIALARIGFYLEGYGPVTREAARLLDGSARYGVDVVRDHGALGQRSGSITAISYVPIVRHVMGSARRLVDLGCGDGSLLVEICRRHPEVSAVGLDVAPAAIAAATARAERAGVADRAHFAVADAFDPATWPSTSDHADVICAVGVMHEKFRDGERAVIDLLDILAKQVAGGRVLLLGEPELRYDNRENDSDFFLVHVLTGQGIPRDRAGWLAVFARSDLRCRGVYTSAVAGPRTCFFELVSRY